MKQDTVPNPTIRTHFLLNVESSGGVTSRGFMLREEVMDRYFGVEIHYTSLGVGIRLSHPPFYVNDKWTLFSTHVEKL